MKKLLADGSVLVVRSGSGTSTKRYRSPYHNFRFGTQFYVVDAGQTLRFLYTSAGGSEWQYDYAVNLDGVAQLLHDAINPGDPFTLEGTKGGITYNSLCLGTYSCTKTTL